MTTRYAAIPTRGPLHDRLAALLTSIDAVGATPILLHPMTGPQFLWPSAMNLAKEQLNFQAWVNQAQRAVQGVEAGPSSFLLLLGDDIVIEAAELDSIFEQAETTGADVLTMDDRGPVPWSPMTGWLFGIRPGVILADEEFVWWWGDDDLWLRAEAQGLTLHRASAIYRHDRADKGSNPPEFNGAMAADEARFWERYPSLRPEA